MFTFASDGLGVAWAGWCGVGWEGVWGVVPACCWVRVGGGG
jgi:hypothetical protein